MAEYFDSLKALIDLEECGGEVIPKQQMLLMKLVRAIRNQIQLSDCARIDKEVLEFLKVKSQSIVKDEKVKKGIERKRLVELKD